MQQIPCKMKVNMPKCSQSHAMQNGRWTRPYVGNPMQNGRWTCPNVANPMQNGRGTRPHVANPMQNDKFKVQTVANTRQIVPARKSKKKAKPAQKKNPKTISHPYFSAMGCETAFKACVGAAIPQHVELVCWVGIFANLFALKVHSISLEDSNWHLAFHLISSHDSFLCAHVWYSCMTAERKLLPFEVRALSQFAFLRQESEFRFCFHHFACLAPRRPQGLLLRHGNADQCRWSNSTACMSDHKPSRTKIDFASDRVHWCHLRESHEVDLIEFWWSCILHLFNDRHWGDYEEVDTKEGCAPMLLLFRFFWLLMLIC